MNLRDGVVEPHRKAGPELVDAKRPDQAVLVAGLVPNRGELIATILFPPALSQSRYLLVAQVERQKCGDASKRLFQAELDLPQESAPELREVLGLDLGTALRRDDLKYVGAGHDLHSRQFLVLLQIGTQSREGIGQRDRRATLYVLCFLADERTRGHQVPGLYQQTIVVRRCHQDSRLAEILERGEGRAIMRYCHLNIRTHLVSRTYPAPKHRRDQDAQPGRKNVEVADD